MRACHFLHVFMVRRIHYLILRFNYRLRFESLRRNDEMQAINQIEIADYPMA